MSFTFAAPNGVHYKDANVKQIDVPSFSGSFGILPNHVPALAVLAPGTITVYEESGDSNKFFVSSGTVTINDDSRYVNNFTTLKQEFLILHFYQSKLRVDN